MGIDSQNANSRQFESSIPGTICMPGFMNAPVVVTLKVDAQYPDLLRVSIRYDDPMGDPEPVFVHRFSLSVRQLFDGRSARMLSSTGHVSPAPNRKVAIQGQTWHWYKEVEVSREDVDGFFDELDRFLAG